MRKMEFDLFLTTKVFEYTDSMEIQIFFFLIYTIESHRNIVRL